ncbi:hypothetical protein ACJMK2_038943, partial [Sinanodonta woodiana]
YQKMVSKVKPVENSNYGADKHDRVAKLIYFSRDAHSSNGKYTRPSFHSMREMYLQDAI